MKNYQDLDIKRLLKEERKKNGYTYEETANGIGCSSSYVYRVEKGSRKTPAYKVVNNIINFFGLKESDLLKYRTNANAVEVQRIKLMEQLEKINTKDFEEVSQLIQNIEKYQKTIKDQEVEEAQTSLQSMVAEEKAKNL